MHGSVFACVCMQKWARSCVKEDQREIGHRKQFGGYSHYCHHDYGSQEVGSHCGSFGMARAEGLADDGREGKGGEGRDLAWRERCVFLVGWVGGEWWNVQWRLVGPLLCGVVAGGGPEMSRKTERIRSYAWSVSADTSSEVMPLVSILGRIFSVMVPDGVHKQIDRSYSTKDKKLRHCG